MSIKAHFKLHCQLAKWLFDYFITVLRVFRLTAITDAYFMCFLHQVLRTFRIKKLFSVYTDWLHLI